VKIDRVLFVHPVLALFSVAPSLVLQIMDWPLVHWPLVWLARPYSGLTENELALVPFALCPVGPYFGLVDNRLALDPVALSPENPISLNFVLRKNNFLPKQYD
jgi:hypothetical protein